MLVAITQFELEQDNRAINTYRAERLIKEAAEEGAKLIIFPEMTLTGYSMNLNQVVEQPSSSESIAFFRKMTRLYGIAICFGYVELQANGPENKVALLDNGRVVGSYTKVHPFSYCQEEQYFAAGTEPGFVSFGGIDFGLYICYDLRFPALFQANASKTQAQIVIANWPKERVTQWQSLLVARAIETQSYVLGVNRSGDGEDSSYVESSFAVDPYGNMIGLGYGDPVIYAELDRSIIEQYRKEFPVLQDRRTDLYKRWMEDQS